jgi:1-acyl-sn-glycerol-3-phosphate acyltransferase
MISIFLPAPVVGALTFLALLANVILWGGLILLVSPLKLIPLAPVRRAVSLVAVWFATQWVSFNKILYRLLHPVSWQIDDRVGRLDPRKSYLIIANHQSWADILILFDLFHLRLPFLRFFLKHELFYVPLIGTGCWALDMPFMKRHSREAVAKNPALHLEDIETTRRACAAYREQPVGLVNFLEGTRFSEAKRIARKSPHRHLLRAKAAGLSFTLNAMGEQFGGIIDVTLAYRPSAQRTPFWSWCCGEQDQLMLHMDLQPIPADMLKGDYENDPEYRSRFQNWVNGLWTRKDARLERMLNSQPLSAARPAHHY